MLDILFDVAVYLLIGAPIGLLYPPKSHGWAAWQRIGWTFGAAALASCATVVIAACIGGWSTLLWLPIGVAIVTFIGFSIIGNASRLAHGDDV